MSALVERLQALYKPAHALPAADLLDLAEGLSAQLTALSADPSPDRCETVAANLDGARRAVLRLRAVLMEVRGE